MKTGIHVCQLQQKKKAFTHTPFPPWPKMWSTPVHSGDPGCWRVDEEQWEGKYSNYKIPLRSLSVRGVVALISEALDSDDFDDFALCIHP